MQPDGQMSPSGVWIANDFRSNLIIDRYDPVFADMRGSKLKHLRSANSEDAVTGTCFAPYARSHQRCGFLHSGVALSQRWTCPRTFERR